MLKQYLLRPILAEWVVSLLLVNLILTACGGATEPTSEAPVTPAVTEETIDASTAIEAQATEEQKATATEKIATEEVAPEAGCQAVEIPANDLIAAVSDTDWTKGPANAPVTLIEYGDFQ